MFFNYLILIIIVINLNKCLSTSKQPNIVLILGDDMGWNDVGFHGNNALKTPNIDALAYNGIILNRHYTAPTCTPSRAALLTGNLPIRSGLQGWPLIAGENRTLPHQMRTLPEHLKSLGYSTHLVGKWHLGSGYKNVTPTRRGFDTHFGYWNGYIGYFNYISPSFEFQGKDIHDGFTSILSVDGQYTTEVFTKKAENIINELGTDEPLFLMLSHLAGHTGADGFELGIENQTANDIEFSHIRDKRRRLYAGIMKSFDDSLGRVVECLAKKNILDNTIILVMSDNGGPTVDMFNNTSSNWPLRGIKGTITDGGVRTFAAIWSTQFKKRAVVNNELIHLVDWLPTLYAAAGGDVTSLTDIDGINQWDVLVDNLKGAPREMLVHMDEVRGESAIISNGTFKLVKVNDYNYMYDYYGEEEKNDYPRYDYRSVLESTVHKNLVAFSKPLSIKDLETIREEAEIVCDYQRNETTRNLTLALFNLDSDPCETKNIANDEPQLVERLLKELIKYENELVPQQNNVPDPCSNPKYYDGYWSTWLSDPSPHCRAATHLI